jgi:hypothetical protein
MTSKMDVASVLVTPLQPPFGEPLHIFSFDNEIKELAVSSEDAAKIEGLLGGKPERREIVMEAEGGMIKVSVSQ